MAVAAAARRLPDGVVLYVVATDADIESAVDDISFFLGALEGTARRGDRAAGAAVPFHPGRSLSRLRASPESRVGAGAGACMRSRTELPASSSPRRLACCRDCPIRPRCCSASHEIKPGMDIDPHALANTLVAGGYEPADPVDAHGEFGRRGGILDIFPAGDELPVRIEFIGDTVESIRRFDPGTQRSVETLDRFGLVPVREGGAGRLATLDVESVSVLARSRYPAVAGRADRCRKASRHRMGAAEGAARGGRSQAKGRAKSAACRADAHARGDRPAPRRCHDSRRARPRRRRGDGFRATGRVVSRPHCRLGCRRPRCASSAATSSCSSPARTAEPSARWNCCATTTSAR